MSKLTPFFKDRPASKIRDSIVFSPTLLAYVTGTLPTSVSTPATQRLNLPVTDIQQPVSRSYEVNGVGGKRILNVLIPVGSDENDEQIDISHLNAQRTGRNIKSYRHFSSQVFRPMIRISPSSFFEKENASEINHRASFDSFGFGMFYKTVDRNYKLIPVKDFSELIPKDLLDKNFTSAYPFVFEGKNIFNQFVDPSHPKNDGAVDVFDVRHSLVNHSVSDIRLYGAKGALMGGGIIDNKKGSSLIVNKVEIRQTTQCEIFQDAQETIFNQVNFQTRGMPGSLSNKVFPLPGYIDAYMKKISPFDETFDPISGSYSYAMSDPDMQNFLTGSRYSKSEIGTRFKSATNGLIFGESNPLGTDSIAFGGFKK